MNKRTFFDNEKATLTCMVQGDNPDRIKELMKKSAPQGAEAFGIQLEQTPRSIKSFLPVRRISLHM